MGGFAGPDLAIAVTKAGGLGLIGAVDDMQNLDQSLDKVEQNLERVDGLLPIGVGLIVFITKSEAALPVLEKHKPAVVWFFAAPGFDDYARWADSVRKVLPKSQIWVQVGSVDAALQVAEKVKPNVICAQGSDAGGHGFEKGAGIISLVPEISDSLAAKGHNIHLVAAGGIADGRAVAAALSLGAQGAVLGTRFLSAKETQVHPVYQKAVIAAQDGGQSTIRSKLFDNLRGPNVWPYAYDGRSLIMESFDDHQRGVDIEEIRQKHNSAVKAEDGGFAEGGKGRAAIWAGTGVGLVKAVQPASDIVEEVRDAARKILEGAGSRL
jgi:nitronate monooxygenase